MLRTTHVENGDLRGMPGTDPRVTAYRGIPFAAPPTGENRWRAPQPCPDWEGVLDAYTYGPISYQETPGLGTDVYCREWHVDPEIPMSEDSLYLNVWTPAKTADEKLPVLFWIYGGGFQWGYTAEMEFDGERLARRGIVVVTVAYRLGVFGFLCHPEITKGSPDAPANFGLLDQQAALRWVHRNIAAFGGDPERITIAGQSAGGGSVLQQLTCEENADLISGAAIISGMIRNPNEKQDIFKPLTLEQAEKKGEEFFAFLGVKSLAEARAIDSAALLDAYDRYVADHSRVFPVTDGIFSKGDALDRLIAGKCAKVPVMAGYTKDEFVYGGVNIVQQTVHNTLKSALEKDPSRRFYCYCFGPDIPGWDDPGCFHSVDLWFFFETLGKCWRPFAGRHFELARTMADEFADFVKTGSPNGKGWADTDLPEWRPFTADDAVEMAFTSEGAVLRKV